MALPLSGIASLVNLGFMERLARSQKTPAQAASAPGTFSTLLSQKNSAVSAQKTPQLSEEARQSMLKERWRALLNCPEVKIPFLESAKISSEKMDIFMLPDGEYYIGERGGHMRRVKDCSDDVQSQVNFILQLVQPHEHRVQ